MISIRFDDFDSFRFLRARTALSPVSASRVRSRRRVASLERVARVAPRASRRRVDARVARRVDFRARGVAWSVFETAPRRVRV